MKYAATIALLVSGCSFHNVERGVKQVWSLDSDGISVSVVWDFPVLENLTPTIVLGTVETLE